MNRATARPRESGQPPAKPRAVFPFPGMPADVEVGLRAERLLRADGPHATGRAWRRLTSWSILTRWRGLTGAFGSPSLKSALRLAVKASNRPRQRKSKHRALLLTAFVSGGWRRSEVAALRVEDLADEDPVRADPFDKSAPLPCLCQSASAAPRRQPTTTNMCC
ncbi:hypothetical protein BN406_06612 (plasmid) [Sinorhizobium meliloti Rm41]|nr:hypothetical protein BN406_06612 [Sinorhizobium meliloti Rm41]